MVLATRTSRYAAVRRKFTRKWKIKEVAKDSGWGGMRMAKRCFLLSLCSLCIWAVIYLPLHFQVHLPPHPDVRWMLTQRNLVPLVQPGNDTYLQNPESVCSGEDPFLLVVVCSSVPNWEARRAIRATWARASVRVQGPTTVLFLLGRSENDTWEDQVAEESRRYGDLVQGDFMDTYNNLTVKSVMLLKWVNSTCPRARYIMKTDDDMFVNLPNLAAHLQAKGHKGMLLGCLIMRAVPVRDWTSKWYVPELVFSDRVYPDYLSGTGYVMSGDVVPRLYNAALHTPFFYLEDIFITGLCAQSAGLKRYNHEGFKFYKRKDDPCLFRRIITGHRMTPDSLYAMWRKIHSKALKCS